MLVVDSISSIEGDDLCSPELVRSWFDTYSDFKHSAILWWVDIFNSFYVSHHVLSTQIDSLKSRMISLWNWD